MTIDKRLGCFYEGLDSDFYAQFYLGLCEVALPAPEDIQGLYLANSSINFATNTITDESGNGNDATLVESNCATGDGVVYATAGTEDIYTATKVPFLLHFKESATISEKTLINKWDYSANLRSFYIATKDHKLFIALSSTGIDTEAVSIPINLVPNEVYYVDGVFNNGNISGTINGVAFSVNTTTTSIFLGNNDIELTIMALKGSVIYRWNNSVYRLKLGDKEFNFSEGNGYETFATDGTKATFSGYTLSTLWGTKQPYNHFNLKKGFSYLEAMPSSNKASTEVNYWRIKVKQFKIGESVRYMFMADSTGIVNGYSLFISYTDGISFEKFTGGNAITYNIGYSADLFASDCDIEVTRDGSGNFEVFLNGISIYTTNDTTYTTSVYKLYRNYGSQAYIVEYDINGNYLHEDYMTRYPASSVNTGKDVLGFDLTHPAGKWHNGAETKIQLPASLSSVQDAVPISSLTDNKNLRWVGDILINWSYNRTGINQVEPVSNGTLIYKKDSNTTDIIKLSCINAGVEYDYYFEIEEVGGNGGGVAIGNQYVVFNSTGVFQGTKTSTINGNIRVYTGAAPSYVVISKLYVWEAGTIPPLSYEEMQTNFNIADRVFMKNECKNKKSLVLYNRQLTTAEQLKVYKAIGLPADGCDLQYDVDGNVLVDADGLPILPA